MKTNELLASDVSENKEETYGNLERKEYIRRQEEKGKVILFPEDNELFIDCDTMDHFNNFINSINILNNNLELFTPETEGEGYFKEVEIWESQGGPPGRHIIVTLPFNVTSIERIAYQTALGSDPIREILSIVRIKNGDDFPTILVEKSGFKRR